MADVKSLRCVDELKTKLLQTKENLKNLDEHIKKHSWGGRADQFTEGNNRVGAGGPFQRRPPPAGSDQSVNNRLIGLATGGSYVPSPAAMRRGVQSGGPMMGRGAGNAFSRLGLPVGGRRREQAPDSGDEADDVPARRPSVQSSVIATPRDEKSRQDMIAQQSGGNEGRARNKRMFGLLMGTLVQFKQEEQTKTDQVQKRKAVELKLEEKQREQKEKEKAEHRQKLEQLRNEKRHLRHLEQKMELADLHTEWEEHTRTLMHSVRTDSKPHIFFVPKLHNEATVKKLAASTKALEAIIEERRKLLEQDIEDLTTNTDEALINEDDHQTTTGDQENNAVGLRACHHAKTSHRSKGGDTRKVVETRPKISDEGNHSDLEQSDVVNLGIDYETVGHVDQEGTEKTGGKNVVEDMDVEGGNTQVEGGDCLPEKFPEAEINVQMQIGDYTEHGGGDEVKLDPGNGKILDTEQSDKNIDDVASVKDKSTAIIEEQLSHREEPKDSGKIDLPKVVNVADSGNITLAVKKSVNKSANSDGNDSDSKQVNITPNKRSKDQGSGSRDVEKERSSHRKRPRRDYSSRSDDDSDTERRSERKRREKRRHRDERDRHDDNDPHRHRHGNERDSKRRKDVSKGRDHSSVVKITPQDRTVSKKSTSPDTDNDNNDIRKSANESLAQK